MPSSPKPPASSLRQWEGIVFLAPSGLAEEIVGQVGDQTHGAAIDPVPQRAGWSQVTIYLRLDGGADPGPAIREALQRHGARAADAEIRRVVVEDGRWVERFQESLHPFDLGRGYRVFPRGVVEGEIEPGRSPLLLIPGRAFGTGEHATTQLCVELLEQHVAAGSRWLDLGCGTGVLSFVAARAGAGEVLAVDVDPDAVQVAETVLTQNGAPPQVSIRQGTLESVDGTFDGLVANIHAPIFFDQARAMAQRVAPGGRLIASGFMADQAAAVAASLERAGLQLLERPRREPWCALLAPASGGLNRPWRDAGDCMWPAACWMAPARGCRCLSASGITPNGSCGSSPGSWWSCSTAPAWSGAADW